VCPGGYDSADACCLDSSRNNDGTCRTYYNVGDDEGQPDCLTEFCVYEGNFNDYNFDTSMGGYSCYETNPDN